MVRALISVVTVGLLAITAVTFLVTQHETDAGSFYVVDSTAAGSLGTCMSDPNDCTLQDAINTANATPADIHFNLPGCPGACTISPTAALPALTASNIVINGITQPGVVGDEPIVILDGSGLVAGNGLLLEGAGSEVNGLIVQDFPYAGVYLAAADQVVRNSQLTGNEYGVRAEAERYEIVDNVATGNTEDGIGASNLDELEGGLISGNVITGNTARGVAASGAGTTITENTITGNGDDGISAAYGGDSKVITNNTIENNVGSGITNSRQGANISGNTVSGNGGAGIYTFGDNTTISDNEVTGSLFGIVVESASTVVGNSVSAGEMGGVYLAGSGSVVGGTGAGEPNTIFDNAGPGILVPEPSQEARGIGPAGFIAPPPEDNTISANSIFSNGGLGIDLSELIQGPDGVTPNDTGDDDGSSNRLQNFPMIDQAMAIAGLAVSGSINTRPQVMVRIEFFANDQCDGSGLGEGEVYLGLLDVMTDTDGNAQFATSELNDAAPGQFITATATHLGTGDTSEFSICVEVLGKVATPTPEPTVEPTSTPTSTATAVPTETPVATPTSTPVVTPTPGPTETPGPGIAIDWGDADCDGDADAVDALKTLQFVALIGFTQEEPCFPLGDPVTVSLAAGIDDLFGDIDCDNDVDAVDALGILRFIAALPVNQQPDCPELGSPVTVGG